MGGEVASKKSLWGNLGDESRAPQGGWLAEARKKEAVAAKAADGAEAEIGGPGGEVTEGERETDTDK